MRFIAAVTLVALAAVPPAGAQTPSTDTAFGVWPWLVGNVDASVPSIIQHAQTVGTDTIYLHLWRTTGPGAGTLYMADETGTFNLPGAAVNPLVTLSSFIAQAHAANLQVIGVVNCFLDTGPLPGDAAHEQLLLAVMSHLVDTTDLAGNPRYALDGIALDRIRFYSGTSNPSAPVTAFCQQAKDAIAPLSLHAFLMAILFYFDGPPYDGVFNSYAVAMSGLQGQFGQHWEQLAGVLDVMNPMAYIAEGGLYGSNTAPMSGYLQAASAYAQLAIQNAGRTGNVRVLPAVRAWNDATGTTTPASLDACLGGAQIGGADGTMIFRYFTALGQTAWWNVIASYADPLPDLPVARLTATQAGGNTYVLDASTSTSTMQPSATLEARFDLDGDGVADTPWSLAQTATFLAPGSGASPVAVEVRDALGRTAGRRRKVVATQAGLSLSGLPLLSASAGGTVAVNLALGTGAARHPYLVVASLSGTSPGTVIGPATTLPIVPDMATAAILDLTNTTLFPGFLGELDVLGTRSGAVSFPPGFLPPVFAFQSLSLAAFTVDPLSGLVSSATDAEAILFLP